MNISVTLNGKKTVFEAQSEESLMSVLHNKTSAHVKCGCLQGFCGACTVLLNNEPVAACKLPVGIIRNAEIITLDYFEKTEEYNNIIKGFAKAGIQLCGYCDAGKIFTAYKILSLNKKVSREEISDYVKFLAPCCTDLDTLVNGILFALVIQSKNNSNIRQSTRTSKR